MSVPESSLDQWMGAEFWSRQRNRILGGVLLLVLVIVAWHFISSRSGATEGAGWEALWQPTQSPVRDDVDPSGAAKGTKAEPWALFVAARKALSDKQFDKSRELAQRLIREFPDNARVRDGGAQKLLDLATGEAQFIAAHPPRTQNPTIDAGKSLSLTTELGEVRIGLYVDQAPTASKALLEAIRASGATGWSIEEAVRDAYVVLAAPAPAAAADPKEPAASAPDETKKPPASLRGIVTDRNGLSHFKGAVSILRQPEPGPKDPAVRMKVRIELRDDPYTDDAEVVCGGVTGGLELLQQASARETKKDGRSLAKAIPVTAITEGADLGAIR